MLGFQWASSIGPFADKKIKIPPFGKQKIPTRTFLIDAGWNTPKGASWGDPERNAKRIVLSNSSVKIFESVSQGGILALEFATSGH